MSIKIFSHRGFVEDGIKENTLKAFQNAYKHGFRGIECDILYLKNQLVLKHNYPINLKNLTTLEGLFSEFKNKIEYWLDFKNLNKKNCDSALKEFKKITENFTIKPQQLYFAPFITNLSKAQIIYQSIRKYFGKKAQILSVAEKLNPKDYEKFYHELKENDIYGLSVQHKNINVKFRKIFHDIKIFAWTVNSPKTANLLEKTGIENIVSDNLIPKND